MDLTVAGSAEHDEFVEVGLAFTGGAPVEAVVDLAVLVVGAA